MSVATTALYAAALGLFYIALSFKVSFTRGATDISLGDGGNRTMLAAIRRHGNFAEYTPFALVLMGFAEIGGLGTAWLHAAGLLLLAGRVVHLFAITEEGGPLPARVVGMLSTYAAMLIAIGGILFAALA